MLRQFSDGADATSTKARVLSHNPFSSMGSTPLPTSRDQLHSQSSQQNQYQQGPNVFSPLQTHRVTTQAPALAIPHGGVRGVNGGVLPASSRGTSIGAHTTPSASMDGSHSRTQRISQYTHLLKKEPPEFLKSMPLRVRPSRPATPVDNISEASGVGLLTSRSELCSGSTAESRTKRFDMDPWNSQVSPPPPPPPTPQQVLLSRERPEEQLQKDETHGDALSALAPHQAKENGSLLLNASSSSAEARPVVATTLVNNLVQTLPPAALQQQQKQETNYSDRPLDASPAPFLNKSTNVSKIPPPPPASPARGAGPSVGALGNERRIPTHNAAPPAESKETAAFPLQFPPPSALHRSLTSINVRSLDNSSTQLHDAGDSTVSALALRVAERHDELHTPRSVDPRRGSHFNAGPKSEGAASAANSGLTELRHVTASPAADIAEESPSPHPPSRHSAHESAFALATPVVPTSQLLSATDRADAQRAPSGSISRVRCITLFAAGGRIVTLRNTACRGTTMTAALAKSEYMTALRTVTAPTPQDAVQRMPGVNPLLRGILALMLREPRFNWRTTGHKELIALVGSALPSSGNNSGEEKCAGTHPLGPRHASGVDADAAAAGLREVQLQLCAGEREKAVEVALHHRLYAHAIIIAMMCPKKESYLSVIRAVVEGELDSTSPLAHAYCMFNELPLPPFTATTPAGNPGLLDQINDGIKANGDPDFSLRTMWIQQAGVLIANFTKESADGLIQLGDSLIEKGMIDEAHCCFLLAHLTPMGTQQPGRPLHARQQNVMDLLRARLGIIGGRYHPRHSRTAFVSLKSTLFTEILQGIRVRLEEERAKESAGDEGKGLEEHPQQQLWHSLPQCPERYRVAFRYMQVLWMREVGMLADADTLMAIVAAAAPEPSRDVQHSTLNRLIAHQSATLFNTASESHQQPVFPTGDTLNAHPPQSLSSLSHASLMESTTGPPSLSAPFAKSTTGPPPLSAPIAKSATDLPTPPSGTFVPCASPMLNSSAENSVPPPPAQRNGTHAHAHAHPPPPLPPRKKEPQETQQIQQQIQPPPPPPQQQQQQQQLQQQPQPHPAPNSSVRSAEAHAALKPPPPKAAAAPPETNKTKETNPPETNTTKETNPPAPRTRGRAEAPQSPPGRRSRSLEVIAGFFFRPSKSRDTAKDDAKKMIIDTEKPPTYDPVTKRYLFAQSEEEKRAAEMIKAGPPLPSAAKSKSGGGPPGPSRPPGGPARAQYVDMFNT